MENCPDTIIYYLYQSIRRLFVKADFPKSILRIVILKSFGSELKKLSLNEKGNSAFAKNFLK